MVNSLQHMCRLLISPVLSTIGRQPHLRMCPGAERWLRPRWFTACTIILPVQLTLPWEGTRGNLWGDEMPRAASRTESRKWNVSVRAGKDSQKFDMNFRTSRGFSSLIQHPLPLRARERYLNERQHTRRADKCGRVHCFLSSPRGCLPRWCNCRHRPVRRRRCAGSRSHRGPGWSCSARSSWRSACHLWTSRPIRL